LRDRLAEPAIANYQGIGAIGYRPVALAAAGDDRFFADAARGSHQERRRRHRQGDDRAKKARCFRCDQIALLRLSKENEAELTALAHEQTQREGGAPVHLERQPDQ
jgi:hypothetical protein